MIWILQMAGVPTVDAVALIAGMLVYALSLRSLGFLTATFLFLALGGLLGERRYWLLVLVAAVASYGIWYLVDLVLVLT